MTMNHVINIDIIKHQGDGIREKDIFICTYSSITLVGCNQQNIIQKEEFPINESEIIIEKRVDDNEYVKINLSESELAVILNILNNTTSVA